MKIAPRKSSPRRPLRRGLVTVMVIIMFVFIAAAIVSLTLLFATEIRRTRSAVAGAQLRQLLLAATPAVAQDLTLHGSIARDLPIRTPLANATLTANITPAVPDRATIRITAKLPPAAAAETLTYVRTGDRWQLASVTLHAEP